MQPLLHKYILLFLSLLLLNSCASLPSNRTAPETYALTNARDTRLGRESHALTKKNSLNSSFVLLANGIDAFAARIGLARHADRSIDAQYYMIHDDLTGNIFVDELLEAADRGVRVRILIDDMDLIDRDDGIAIAASHPNIFIRIFNPFIRSIFRSRTSQFVTRFGSVTRRMHNKSFTVDNQVTIVGGRNIGDEYFEANPALSFADLDILAIGAVVPEVSASFDEYWNSTFAYPIQTLKPELPGKKIFTERRKELTNYVNSKIASEYKEKLLNSQIRKSIQNDTLNYTPGSARVLSDHPDKLSGYDAQYSLTLASQLDHYLQNLKKELLIFSPYFVPGKIGTELLCNLSRNGVRIRILTNSLASTDVGIVHAGYAKYRTTLLRAGVELYELDTVLSREERKAMKENSPGSKASLHAKSFVFDRKRTFVGSLNLDPRSLIENTEIGIMVNSDDLAEEMASGFNQIVDAMAFRLQLVTDEDGIEYIDWHGRRDGNEYIWRTDPYTGFWRRLAIGLTSILPIESQL